MWEAGASGHVDHGESPTDAIIHEAFEEICVKIKERDLKFIGVIHKTIGGKEHAYYNFSFMCTKWKGIPKIGEPEKASELKWFNIKKLPMNIISDRKKVLRQYAKGIYYTNVNESKKVRNYLFKKSS
jgi:ADP-ribose pyrophosphatase YjhB (NUDIX family)